jgi:formylglycine-generating enzyme required for sulfatase activity
VALKLLSAATGLSERSRRRFRAEVRALARLRHPNIVPVYDVIEEGELFAYSMEWVEGATLAACLAHLAGRAGAPDGRVWRSFLGGDEVDEKRDYVDTICELGIAVARALERVHAAGLLHRDVKPSNILLRRDGTALLSDFGLVKGGADALETQPGLFVGTPAFASPEQLRGERAALSVRSDVYSLGATLYQALSLALPYGSSSATEILRRQEDEMLEPLGRVAPWVPRELRTIVHVAMESDPARRYATAGALADDLERLRRGHPILARPSTALYRFRKLVSRHRAASAFSLLFVGALVTFGISTALQVEALREQRVGLMRYSDLGLHGELLRQARDLWPPDPNLLPALEAWLAQAEELAERSRQHRGDLLAQNSRPQARGLDLDRGTGAETASSSPLAELVARLDDFCEPTRGVLADVRARRDFARGIGERSLTSATAAELWREACASIADPARCPAYEGLHLEPTLGLLPLGRNPASGLWEFAHLQSGEPAARGADDEALAIRPETGLVLVLLPGAEFSLGAQGTDPDGPNYDPHAMDHEQPVHDVALEPFFISKYEMTQAQWKRLQGDNPSAFQASTRTRHQAFDDLHPVEQVTWIECGEVTRKLGLVLPTEAQWEYAARAGSRSPWWSGSDPAALVGCCNLEDQSAARAEPPPWPDIPRTLLLEDGFVWHAPVGSFAANSFGLHDMLGNLQEWCRDRQGHYTQGVAAGDGERVEPFQRYRAIRGGAFLHPPWEARVSVRRFDPPAAFNTFVGLRPARPLESR